MIFLGAALVCAVLYVVFRLRDARQLRNGILLVATVVLAVIGVAVVFAPVAPWLVDVANAAFIVAGLAIVVLGIALLANGVTMLRSEGRSLGNLLSLVVGVLIFVLPVLLLALLSLPGAIVPRALAALLVIVVLYVATAFVSFGVYSLVYARIRPRFQPTVIVVLGSGLIGGEVPPLLRSRLDRGLRLYRAEQASGRHPLLIPSGGQGADEPRPEGVAMAQYLVAQGAAAADVHAEIESRNTRQNLEFSRTVQERAARPGPVVVVTNEYHVLRTALLARKIGSDAQVVGSRTALYYVPSAFLREFIAVMVTHKLLNLVAIASFIGLIGYAVVSAYQRS